MDNQPMTPAAELVQLLRVIYAITHDTAPRGLVTSAAINMLPGLWTPPADVLAQVEAQR